MIFYLFIYSIIVVVLPQQQSGQRWTSLELLDVDVGCEKLNEKKITKKLAKIQNKNDRNRQIQNPKLWKKEKVCSWLNPTELQMRCS